MIIKVEKDVVVYFENTYYYFSIDVNPANKADILLL